MPSRRRSASFVHGARWVGVVVAVMTAVPAQTPEATRSPGVAAISGFRLAEGFTATLWAEDPLLANGVAFWIDSARRVYVAETFRQDKDGVPDNRDHGEWLDDDLRAMTVEDRAAYYLKHHPELAEQFTAKEDRISLVLDEDGDGKAERSRVFAGGFKDLLDGTGAGVLRHGKDVFYTCIPHLWRLRDEDGDGSAERRESMFRGFGVRVALRGHDLHGLAMGPDGRLYFSLGDRGYHVVTKEGKLLADPRSGAVFRCELDGSGLEVFATGLRNPQELAFDDRGDLFTVDNNSDSEDRARILFVVEGGETGWRMNFQSLARRGPWVEEGWWKTRFEEQAAFLLPPLEHLGSGPSGLFCDPGTSLPERYRGWLFVCDFLGGRQDSGVRAFHLEPKGAGWRLGRNEHLIKGVLPTDADLGPDGAVWVLDWVEGWVGPGTGRIYRLTSDAATTTAAAETAALLARDFGGMEVAELAGLLGHADRRVRQAAQGALAAKEGSRAVFEAVLADGTRGRFARLHAVWGLWQLGRKADGAAAALRPLLDDGDAEVRAQAARVLGDLADRSVEAVLVRRLDDAEPRVRFHAALALGKVGAQDATAALVGLARQNQDQDVWLRHAVVVALARVAKDEVLAGLGTAPERAVRLVAVLALRRQRSERVAAFLDDADGLVATEAARAIYDVPIARATPALIAAVERNPARPWPFVRRALYALDRRGGAEDALRLAAFATQAAASDEARAEALSLLGEWDPAPPRDRLLNEPHTMTARRKADALQAFRPVAEALLRTAPEHARTEAAEVLARLGLAELAPELERLAKDEAAPPRARARALDAWDRLDAGDVAATALPLLRDPASEVRAAAANALARGKPEVVLPVIEGLLANGARFERQGAVRSLGRLRDERSEALLRAKLDELVAGKLDPEIRLEVLDAARARGRSGSKELLRGVESFERGMPKDDPFAKWLPSLEGGDAVRGRRIFLEKAETTCIRCHHVPGGGDPTVTKAGPNLEGVSKRRDRRTILESIVVPKKLIAEGYETVTIETEADGLVTGRLAVESADAITLEILDTGVVERRVFPKVELLDRRSDGTAMPADLIEKLSPSELRDLVEFLCSL